MPRLRSLLDCPGRKLVSIGDLVRARLDEAQGEADGLRQFVTGGYPG